MCQDVLVIMNRRYNLKWFKPLVLKVGDTLELPGELDNIQGIGVISRDHTVIGCNLEIEMFKEPHT